MDLVRGLGSESYQEYMYLYLDIKIIYDSLYSKDSESQLIFQQNTLHCNITKVIPMVRLMSYARIKHIMCAAAFQS
jgi:hypothetical protein